MPAVTRVVFYDDKAWPEQVEAAEVVRVTIIRQPVAGGEPARRTAELYLTGASAAELDADLDPWFEIGHRPGAAPAGDKQASGKKRLAGGARNASVDLHREMREFFTEHDIRSRPDPSRLVFETPSGSWSYPKWAVELYDQWVADGRPPQRKAG